MADENKVAVYTAVDFLEFSGRLYMPALELVSKRSTLRRHELPTFYETDSSLMFFHPLLKKALLFISGPDPHARDIVEKIRHLFKNDVSFDFFSEKKVSLNEKGYKCPSLYKTNPSGKAKGFVEFLEELASGRPITGQFDIAAKLEADKFAPGISDDARKKYLDFRFDYNKK